jgi:HicA-like toxin of HicAB toxin-antitoxin system
MTSQKLKKIKQEIAAARQRTNKYRDLEKIAASLERVLAMGAQSRGKEPTFISTAFDRINPITIPNHPGRDIARGTAKAILNQLEEDVLRFEKLLEANGAYENGKDKENDE